MMMNLCSCSILFLGFSVMTLGQNAELDVLFDLYYKWRNEVYPTPNKLGDGELEDFSLSGIKAKIRKCVDFNQKIESLHPEDSRYETYKNTFKEGGTNCQAPGPGPGQVQSSQVQSGPVRSSQVHSGPVRSKSGPVRSSPVQVQSGPDLDLDLDKTKGPGLTLKSCRPPPPTHYPPHNF